MWLENKSGPYIILLVLTQPEEKKKLKFGHMKSMKEDAAVALHSVRIPSMSKYKINKVRNKDINHEKPVASTSLSADRVTGTKLGGKCYQ